MASAVQVRVGRGMHPPYSPYIVRLVRAVQFTGSMASSVQVRLGQLKSLITRMCDAP